MESKVVKFVEAQNRMWGRGNESQWSKDTKFQLFKIKFQRTCINILYIYSIVLSLYYCIVYLNFLRVNLILYIIIIIVITTIGAERNFRSYRYVYGLDEVMASNCVYLFSRLIKFKHFIYQLYEMIGKLYVKFNEMF